MPRWTRRLPGSHTSHNRLLAAYLPGLDLAFVGVLLPCDETVNGVRRECIVASTAPGPEEADREGGSYPYCIYNGAISQRAHIFMGILGRFKKHGD